MRKIIVVLIISMTISGCDLVDMDPTNNAMIEMRDDMNEMNENMNDGITVRMEY